MPSFGSGLPLASSRRTQVDYLDAAVAVRSDRVVLPPAGVDRDVGALAAVDDLGDAGSTLLAGTALDHIVAHAGVDPVYQARGSGEVALDGVVAVGADQHIGACRRSHPAADEVARQSDRGAPDRACR